MQFAQTEPPPTKVEGFSGLERLRRTMGSFPTEVGGFKPDFWKINLTRNLNASLHDIASARHSINLTRTTSAKKHMISFHFNYPGKYFGLKHATHTLSIGLPLSR